MRSLWVKCYAPHSDFFAGRVAGVDQYVILQINTHSPIICEGQLRINIPSGRLMTDVVLKVNSAKFPTWMTEVGIPASLEAFSTLAFAFIQGMRIPCSQYRRQKSEGEKSWTLVLGMAFTKPYCLSVPSSPTRELRSPLA